MKAFIQGINCTAKTIKELDATAAMLGLPEGHSFAAEFQERMICLTQTR